MERQGNNEVSLAMKRYKGKKLHVDVTKEEIQRFVRARTIRILYPHSIMTRDYRQDRVNIFITDDDIIEDINMG